MKKKATKVLSLIVAVLVGVAIGHVYNQRIINKQEEIIIYLGGVLFENTDSITDPVVLDYLDLAHELEELQYNN